MNSLIRKRLQTIIMTKQVFLSCMCTKENIELRDDLG